MYKPCLRVLLLLAINQERNLYKKVNSLSHDYKQTEKFHRNDDGTLTLVKSMEEMD